MNALYEIIMLTSRLIKAIRILEIFSIIKYLTNKMNSMICFGIRVYHHKIIIRRKYIWTKESWRLRWNFFGIDGQFHAMSPKSMNKNCTIVPHGRSAALHYFDAFSEI